MNTNVQTVIDFLSKLGKQITGVAKDIFPIYVQHQHVIGLSCVVVAAILFVLVIGIIAIAIWLNDEDFTCFATGATIIGTLVIVILVINAILHIGNPEYYAIKELLSVIK